MIAAILNRMVAHVPISVTIADIYEGPEYAYEAIEEHEGEPRGEKDWLWLIAVAVDLNGRPRGRVKFRFTDLGSEMNPDRTFELAYLPPIYGRLVANKIEEWARHFVDEGRRAMGNLEFPYPERRAATLKHLQETYMKRQII